MSQFGPSRHFAAAQQSGRFWREADINWKAEPAGLVANDPGCVKTRCRCYDSPVILGGIDEALC
jgi:hypothetical protein